MDVVDSRSDEAGADGCHAGVGEDHIQPVNCVIKLQGATPQLTLRTEATSISIMTRREPGDLSDEVSESVEAMLRTAATTVVLGDCRYAVTRPLPISIVYMSVSSNYYDNEHTAACACNKDMSGRSHC